MIFSQSLRILFLSVDLHVKKETDLGNPQCLPAHPANHHLTINLKHDSHAIPQTHPFNSLQRSPKSPPNPRRLASTRDIQTQPRCALANLHPRRRLARPSHRSHQLRTHHHTPRRLAPLCRRQNRRNRQSKLQTLAVSRPRDAAQCARRSGALGQTPPAYPRCSPRNPTCHARIRGQEMDRHRPFLRRDYAVSTRFWYWSNV
jgi:hypothetical protein